MKILVTGASGFVGSHIADRLIESGHDVRALVRSTSSHRWLKGKPIEVVDGILTEPDSLKAAVTDVDAVVHVAGVTAAKTKQGFFEGNQLATRGLLDAVRKYNPDIQRFIQCSSQTATGPSLDGEPVTELTPPHPITAYGQSKRAAEEECERARNDFPVTILRLPAIYGPRDSAILTFFQTVDKRLKPLIGMTDKRVNLLHVGDVAEGVRLAIEHPDAKNETYFIAGERQHTWREISDLTADIVGKKGVTVRLPHAIVYTVAGLSEFFSMFRKQPSVLNWEKGRDMVQAHWTCSAEKAKRELGYRQQITLEDGIRDTVEWYRKEGWM
jgi:dihydroflavonol-4-reductase